MPIGPGSFTQLPPNSTGPKLATGPTYTENAQTVQDEKVVLGLPYLAQYRNPGGNTAISAATADAHILQIMAGATLHVYVQRIRVYQLVGATTSAMVYAQLLRLTTAGTGGSVQGFSALDPADAAPGATGMTLPTVKGTEGAVVDSAIGYFYQTLPTAVIPAPTLLYDFDFRGGKALKIAAGITNGIAIKPRAGVAAATLQVVADIIEAAY